MTTEFEEMLQVGNLVRAAGSCLSNGHHVVKGSWPAGTAFVGKGGVTQNTKGSSEDRSHCGRPCGRSLRISFRDRCNWEGEVRDKDAQKLENKSELSVSLKCVGT